MRVGDRVRVEAPLSSFHGMTGTIGLIQPDSPFPYYVTLDELIADADYSLPYVFFAERELRSLVTSQKEESCDHA